MILGDIVTFSTKKMTSIEIFRNQVVKKLFVPKVMGQNLHFSHDCITSNILIMCNKPNYVHREEDKSCVE